MSTFLRSIKILSATLVLGISITAAGCGGMVNDPEDQVAAQQAVQKKGALGKFSTALNQVELRTDQRKVVDDLIDQVDQQAEPLRDAKAKIATEVAKQVRTGRIDRAAIEPLLEELARAAEGFVPVIEDSVNKLHSTLDPSQRGELVEVLRDQASEHRGGGREKMKQLAEKLDLTSDQKERMFDAVRAEMGKDRDAMRSRFAEAKERMEKMADAFESDSFDAKAFDGKTRARELVQNGGHRILRVAELVLPILTADQRTKLADEIERRAGDIDE